MLVLQTISVFVCVAQTIYCGPVLDNVPITFQMSGSVTYAPDAGGASRTGYQLRLGFSLKQWLAVQIVTNNNKNDVIVIQIDQFYSQGSNDLHTGHEVMYEDYYRTSDSLNIDQNRAFDISAFKYVEAKDYYIDLIRYTGTNSGEDWNGAANKYSLTEVCFYTNDKLFNISNWRSGVSQCYFFQIDNYHSAFKGQQLKSFYVNGYKTSIYGWIDGPYVTDNIYFYHNVPLYTYTEKPAFVVEVGTTSNNRGQDFYAYSPISTQTGDYYGKSITNMTFDNEVNGGYQHSALTVQYWNADPSEQIDDYSYTTLRVTFSRNISTHDSYDKQLKSTFIFCLYLFAEGTIHSELTDKGCEIVELIYHYPRLSLPERTFESILKPFIIFSVTFLFVLIIS